MSRTATIRHLFTVELLIATVAFILVKIHAFAARCTEPARCTNDDTGNPCGVFGQGWLELHGKPLEAMQVDMAQIERKNNILDVQWRNYQVLLYDEYDLGCHTPPQPSR